jgi:hypothetical protein
MPTFTNPAPVEHSLPAGVYVGKITRAIEKISEAGNSLISMVFTVPDGRRISSIVTFVPAAALVIAALCDSCGLIRPAEAGVQIDLDAQLFRDRHVYFIVTEEHDENGDSTSRVTRFLTREKALRLNPKLGAIRLQEQPPVVLPIIGRSSL